MSGITITVAMAKPVVIQVISCTVAPTAPRMCGSATLTIDASMAPISVPKVTETVTSHLLVGGRAGEGHPDGQRLVQGYLLGPPQEDLQHLARPVLHPGPCSCRPRVESQGAPRRSHHRRRLQAGRIRPDPSLGRAP